MPTPGISVLTALCICNNEVRCEAAGPDKDGKWAGWIMMDVDRWHPLLNTTHIYDSHDAAVQAMKDLVAELRKNPPHNPLDDLEPGLKSAVQDVVRMAKQGPDAQATE